VASIQGSADQVLVVNTAGTALSFGTVATGGIANDAVTYAKMQNVSATSRFIGRITVGSGDPEELTGANAKTIIGSGDLTKTDDTNVTLALGGTPTAALYSAVSLTLGWTGQLALSRGGTGANLADPNIDRIMMWDDSAGTVKFAAPTDLNTEATPTSGDFVLMYDAAGNLLKTDWANLPGASGGIPTIGSSTDNAVVRWNGTGGSAVQNSGVVIDDSDVISNPTKILVADTTDRNLDAFPSALQTVADVSSTWNQTNLAFGNNAQTPAIACAKTRGASIGTHAAVASGDGLFSFFAYGSDGTNYKLASGINAVVDGTVSTGVVPSTLNYYWTDSAGSLKTTYFPRTVALSSDAASNSTTTGVEITELQVAGVTPGTYVFQYFLRYQSGATTTGVKFGINHTGTAAVFAATMRYQESTTAASTGAASQAAAGGTLHAGASTRTKSTTSPNLGPTASVDSANADMLAVIEGYIIVTAAGDLELWHASEVAAASTVKAGSSLILQRTA
jgi:hypothetical protein